MRDTKKDTFMYVHSVQKLKENIQSETANISRKGQSHEMKYHQPQYSATLTQPTSVSEEKFSVYDYFNIKPPDMVTLPQPIYHRLWWNIRACKL